MKSKYFRRVGVDTSELERDLRALQRLPQAQLSAMARFLADGAHLIQRDEAIHKELDKFLRDTGVTGEQYARARRLSLFLVQACEKFDDEPAIIIDDLDHLVSLGSDVGGFLQELSGAVVRAITIQRRGRLATSSLPALQGLFYTCDVRVDLPSFDVFEDDPTARKAEPRGWIPVVLIRFSTDEDAELVCQVDGGALGRAISVLKAAEADLIQVQRALQTHGLVELEEE